jgi:hypothetical protein
MNKHIDEDAASVGRGPSAVRRLLNNLTNSRPRESFLNGPQRQWAEDLADLALEHGVSSFILFQLGFLCKVYLPLLIRF